jgi:hypothetical protein
VEPGLPQSEVLSTALARVGQEALGCGAEAGDRRDDLQSAAIGLPIARLAPACMARPARPAATGTACLACIAALPSTLCMTSSSRPSWSRPWSSSSVPRPTSSPRLRPRRCGRPGLSCWPSSSSRPTIVSVPWKRRASRPCPGMLYNGPQTAWQSKRPRSRPGVAHGETAVVALLASVRLLLGSSREQRLSPRRRDPRERVAPAWTQRGGGSPHHQRQPYRAHWRCADTSRLAARLSGYDGRP